MLKSLGKSGNFLVFYRSCIKSQEMITGSFLNRGKVKGGVPQGSVNCHAENGSYSFSYSTMCLTGDNGADIALLM